MPGREIKIRAAELETLSESLAIIRKAIQNEEDQIMGFKPLDALKRLEDQVHDWVVEGCEE